MPDESYYHPSKMMDRVLRSTKALKKPYCSEQCKKPPYFICARELGHRGPHIAVAASPIKDIEIWDQSTPPPSFPEPTNTKYDGFNVALTLHEMEFQGSLERFSSYSLKGLHQRFEMEVWETAVLYGRIQEHFGNPNGWMEGWEWIQTVERC